MSDLRSWKVLAFVYRLKREEMTHADGECSTDRLTIRIGKNLPAQRVLETVIHESCHSINDQLYLWEKDWDEEMCNALGSALAAVLMDNRRAVEVLLHEAEKERKSLRRSI